MKYDIFALTNAQNACTRIRATEWFEYLPMDYDLHPFFDLSSASKKQFITDPKMGFESYKELLAQRKEIIDHNIFIQRALHPFSRGGIEKKYIKASKFSVYDFDDAIYLDEGKDFFWGPRYYCKEMIKNVDSTIAGNDYLANYASDFTKDITIIPSCVNPENYEFKTDYRQNTPPVAVWTGSRSGEDYFLEFKDQLLRAHKKLGLRLHIIGSTARHLGELETMIDRTEWSEDAVYKGLKDADFGLMLFSKNEWTKGKCAYKLLQYFAAGLPSIATNWGVNEKILTDTGNVPLDEAHELYDAIEEILSYTTAKLEKIGTYSREYVTDYYSFEANKELFLKAINGSK